MRSTHLYASALSLIMIISSSEAWVPENQRLFARPLTAILFSSQEQDAQKLQGEAEKLRQEIASFEKQKRDAKEKEASEEQKAQAAKQELRSRYSAVVPILKPDGSTVEERVDFRPYWDKETSYIAVLEAALPLGIILGESEKFPGATSVDEVAEGSNGKVAGIREGDLVRAFTACKMEMETPAWQLIAGGIGIPKTKRLMFAVDNRPFEEVMDAVASNRMDPEGRPVLLVVERQGSAR